MKVKMYEVVSEITWRNSDSPMYPFRYFYNESITSFIFQKQIYLKFVSTLFYFKYPNFIQELALF
jgi:hypothetical protein